MDEVSAITKALSGDGKLAVIIALLVVGGLREWYVWGPTFRRERAEKEFYRAALLRSLRLTKEAIDVASNT